MMETIGDYRDYYIDYRDCYRLIKTTWDYRYYTRDYRNYRIRGFFREIKFSRIPHFKIFHDFFFTNSQVWSDELIYSVGFHD